MAKGDDIKMNFDFTDLFAGLDGYDETVKRELFEGGVEVGEDGLMRMVEAAPVITGFLRGSATVFVNGELVSTGADFGYLGETAKTAGGRPKTKTIIVWGFNAFYAAARHELEQAGLKAGGGKFVENVLKGEMKRWMEHLASRLRRLKK